ncbi:hypothetical protein [Pontibacter ruber]|uniref:YceI-like domain-containing protein n=1 Tax=Pontibacter ruber TaxID=1343895 RepID=A0ABW5CTD7_9BACT|nr:hypothetical protein [Pontibacter ruber]
MVKKLLFCLLFLLMATSPFAFSQSREPFTSNNTIFITIEGFKSNYDFASKNLLVRYNKDTKKLECLLAFSSLIAANDSTPIVMAQDLFYTSRYPELYIEIEAPVEQINARNMAVNTKNSRFVMSLQGVPLEMTVPVQYTPEEQAITFSTSFDVLMERYRLSLPAKYIPRLTGRIFFTISNARWMDMQK